MIKPTDKGSESSSRTVLDGRCYGSPIALMAKSSVQTEKKLYAFRKEGEQSWGESRDVSDNWRMHEARGQFRLPISPNEVLRPGKSVPVRVVRTLSMRGRICMRRRWISRQVKFDRLSPDKLAGESINEGRLRYRDGTLPQSPQPSPARARFRVCTKR